MVRKVRTAADWLKGSTNLLGRAQVPSARLDALILLEDALGLNRSHILAHPEIALGADQLRRLDTQLIRRAAHEPLAYIRGKSEFYGREFQVTHATLQPRPETETMITLLKSLSLPPQPFLADIGTGSGAIAITAKLEIPEAEVFATEIQADAVRVGRKNAASLQAQITFFKGHLLQPLQNLKLDVILANLPYVPTSHTINQAAMQEPAIAIFGGLDGLDLYRALFKQVSLRKQKPLFVLVESLPFQHKDLASFASTSDYRQTMEEDFIQVFRHKN